MSDNYAYVIPLNENYIPEKGKVELIVALFNNQNKNNLKIEIVINNNLKFYDCGENFEYVKCPFCENELYIEWWQEAMNNAYKNNFCELNVTTPCCGKETSLNNFIYYFSQGFARFAIKIMDFEIDKFEIDDALLNDLTTITYENWKVIYSRY